MSVPGAEGQNSNKNSDESENQNAQPGNNKNDDVQTEISQEGENDSKEPGSYDFMQHLTVQDCANLKVDDKIDFRDTNQKRYGKFIEARIFEKKGTVLTLYLPADGEIIDIDFKNEKNLRRMAIHKSVSKRAAQSDLKNLNVDNVIDVNPSLRNRSRVSNTNSKNKNKNVDVVTTKTTTITPGDYNESDEKEKEKEIETIWYPGRIRKMDKHSGQVQITYKVGKKKLHYWTHLDNGNEIASFGTKCIQKKRMQPSPKNKQNDNVNNKNANFGLIDDENAYLDSSSVGVAEWGSNEEEDDDFSYSEPSVGGEDEDEDNKNNNHPIKIGNTAYGPPEKMDKNDTGASASSNSAARPHFENGQQRKVKCWECPVCECMNKLEDTLLKNNFKCVNQCGGVSYQPNGTITVFSNTPQLEPFAQEGGNENNNGNQGARGANVPRLAEPEVMLVGGMVMYPVWQCPQCPQINSVSWDNCAAENCKFARNTFGEPIKSEVVEKKPVDPTEVTLSVLEQQQFQEYENGMDRINYNNANRGVQLVGNPNRNVQRHYGGYNYNNNQYNHNRNLRRYEKERKLAKMGTMVQYCDYPATGFSTLVSSNVKLDNEFGFVYTNAYRPEKPLNEMKDSYPFIFKPKMNENKSDDNDNENDNENKKNDDLSLIKSECDKIALKFGCIVENRIEKMQYRIQNERNIALNQENGWLAAIMTEEGENINLKLNDNMKLEKEYSGIYLSVFECDGSFEYKQICFKKIKILDELKDFAKASHNNVTMDEILRMARVRFNGNSVYVFGWTKNVKIVYHYEIRNRNRNRNKIDKLKSKKKVMAKVNDKNNSKRGSGVFKGLISGISGLIGSGNEKEKKEQEQEPKEKGKGKEKDSGVTVVTDVEDNKDTKDNKDNKDEYELNQVGHYIDEYWNKVDVMDIDVIHFDESSGKENLVAVLFGEWIGYYTIIQPKMVKNDEYKYDLKWFHACAFSRCQVDSHSFDCISYDHTSEDNLFTNVISKEECDRKFSRLMDIREKGKNADKQILDQARKTYLKKSSNKNKNNNLGFDFDEKEENPSDTDYGVINVTKMYTDGKTKAQLLKCDFDMAANRFERYSHRYYNYIHCENSDIVCHHPSNPEFEFMRAASGIKPNQSLYAISKQYGVFYTDSKKNIIYNCNSDGINIDDNTFEITKKIGGSISNRDIKKLIFDESYGISGRLLIQMSEKINDIDVHSIDCIVNERDLDPLKEQLKKNQISKYFLMKYDKNNKENKKSKDGDSKNSVETTSDENNTEKFLIQLRFNENEKEAKETAERIENFTKYCWIVYEYLYGSEFMDKHYGDKYLSN